MKILHIITSMDPEKGGVCQAVRNIIFANTFGTHEVVCLDVAGQDYGFSEPFKIYQIGGGFTGFQYHKGLVTWLRNHLTDYDAAIVHGVWQFHNIAVHLAFRKLDSKEKRPLICVMPHGMLDPYFQRDPSRRLKALRNELLWRITERHALNSADAVLFTCEQELLLARETFSGYHPRHEVNVGLGVAAPPDFVPSMEDAFRSLLPGVNRFWLYLSRIHPKKGVDLLLDAYNTLQRTYHNIPDLVIAGPIDSDYAISLKKQFGNSSKIHFTGMLSGDTKWGAMYGSDCFVLPSHQENFGIAIVEALACGKPVLITDQVNIYKEILDVKAGLIEKDTFEGVLDLLSKFWTLSDSQIQNMKSASKDLYHSKYSIRECAESFFDSIEKMAEQN